MMNRIALAVICLFLAAPAAGSSFADYFNAPTLDPAWQVYSFSGARVYGYPTPANHYSLTDNPGYLRYYLDEMTHPDGFVNGFLTDNEHSCCPMDPGLDLRRALSGDHWTLVGGADFAFGGSNGRAFYFTVAFGDGQAGTYVMHFVRGEEWYGPWAYARLSQTNQVTPLVSTDLAIVSIPPLGTQHFRFDRDGGLLTASWSTDALTWNVALTYDLGSALNGIDQQVILNGAAWFIPGGSRADWDYVVFNAVPEPATLLLLGSGLTLIGAALRRRKS